MEEHFCQCWECSQILLDLLNYFKNLAGRAPSGPSSGPSKEARGIAIASRDCAQGCRLSRAGEAPHTVLGFHTGSLHQAGSMCAT